MSRTRRIAILVYDGIQSLDLTGPLEAFAIANRLLRARDPVARSAYTVEVIAPAAGIVTTSSGLRLVADRPYRAARTRLDTLLVAGGNVQSVIADRPLLRWLSSTARRVRRVAS